MRVSLSLTLSGFRLDCNFKVEDVSADASHHVAFDNRDNSVTPQ